jgi:hypothetical protein
LENDGTLESEYYFAVVARPQNMAQMTPNDPETAAFSPRQEAVALGVASGLSLAAAARSAKVGGPTAKRWSRLVPAFRRRVQELRTEMTSQALGRLVDAMVGAADTLSDLSRKGKSEMVRLGAARAILELANRTRETVELEEHLQALESQLASDGGAKWPSKVA